MYDLVTVGDIKLDTFIILNNASVQCELKMPDCKLCLEYGAKISVDIADTQIAGSAPNVATGLARMGLKTAVVSNMGPDSTRSLALSHLKKEGVSTKLIRTVKGEVSASAVVLNYKGEKTILASYTKTAYRLPSNLRTEWLYMSEMGPGYEALYKTIIARAKKGLHVGFNPGNVQVAERKPVLFDLIRQTSVLFVNVEEARLLTEKTSDEFHQLASAVWALGPKYLVITDGPNGAYGFDGKTLVHLPIFPGPRVEATGAGDAFATGFLGALFHKQSPLEALRWGSVNSTSVVGKVGPTAGLLSTNQIKNRLRGKAKFAPKAL